MKKFIIILVILFFSINLFALDLMKSLSLSDDLSINSKYPSSAINGFNYILYVNARTYSQIIDINNYDYREGGIFNFRFSGLKLAVGLDAEQFGMGNYSMNRYTGVLASQLINFINVGIAFDLKKLGYTTEYSDPMLNNNKLDFDIGISSSAKVYKELSVGIGCNNILNSESVDGGFIDYATIYSALGYNFQEYGMVSVGFERKEGYNSYLVSYGIKYKNLYVDLNYDFNSIYGKVVLNSQMINKLKIRFVLDVSYMLELGTVYKGGIILLY